MSNVFGASGVYPTPRGQPSIAFDLQPGASRLIPSGTWMLTSDGYSCLQEFDPVQGQWIQPGGDAASPRYVNSDGNNYRVTNLSGCIVGANVTTAGSAYTTATPPAVTVSTGGAKLAAIVGGAVSTSVTVTNGGTNYTYPPLVFLDSPPTPGYQATATCTITSGAVATVTINNQGAGYTNVPNLYFVNDPRDTTGTGAAATAVLTGAGTVTQLYVTDWGNPQTTLQPTISFASGSAAAFPIMVRSIGAFTLSNVGSGYSGVVEISALGSGYIATANVLTNPKWTTNLVRTRKASLIAPLSSSTLTTAAQILLDGGIYAGSSPTAIVYGTTQGAIATGAYVAVAGFTWTNQTSTIILQPV